MNNPSYPVALDLMLPWSEDKSQSARFKAVLIAVSVPIIVFLLAIPHLPIIDTPELQSKPLIKTRLTLKSIPPEPTIKPEPITPKPKPKPKTESKPVEPKKTSAVPIRELKPKPKPTVTKPKETAEKIKTNSPKVTQDTKTADALNALAAQLGSIHTNTQVTAVKSKHVSQSGSGSVAAVEKSVLSQEALLKSNSQTIAAPGAEFTGVTLAKHETTQLEGIVNAKNQTTPRNTRQRSDESIRTVFETGKSIAYRQYQATLDENPTLSGTLVFEIKIEPNGTVSELRLISSDLNSVALESEILNTIRGLDFGQRAVEARRLTYRFNFLPS